MTANQITYLNEDEVILEYSQNLLVPTVNIVKISWYLLSNLQYKLHQIRKIKCFLSRLAVVFGQSIEVRCEVNNEYVVGAVSTGDLSDQPSYCLLTSGLC